MSAGKVAAELGTVDRDAGRRYPGVRVGRFAKQEVVENMNQMGMGISMDFTNWGQKPSVVEDIACANPHTKWRGFSCETHWTKLWIVQLATFDQRMVARLWGDYHILLTMKLVRNNKSAYLLISGFLWCLTIKLWGLLGKSLRHHGENMGKNMGIRWGGYLI